MITILILKSFAEFKPVTFLLQNNDEIAFNFFPDSDSIPHFFLNYKLSHFPFFSLPLPPYLCGLNNNPSF